MENTKQVKYYRSKPQVVHSMARCIQDSEVDIVAATKIFNMLIENYPKPNTLEINKVNVEYDFGVCFSEETVDSFIIYRNYDEHGRADSFDELFAEIKSSNTDDDEESGWDEENLANAVVEFESAFSGFIMRCQIMHPEASELLKDSGLERIEFAPQSIRELQIKIFRSE
ncbi:hypothetical protein [Vibrio crassostreae]|uniref:hypothetical protein n=1 Tax=Vibrio crassostreae TaxID=246167 RepID=UPI001B30BE8A|nr:hypothetical protein [Vibrio crassostreae]